MVISSAEMLRNLQYGTRDDFGSAPENVNRQELLDSLFMKLAGLSKESREMSLSNEKKLPFCFGQWIKFPSDC